MDNIRKLIEEKDKKEIAEKTLEKVQCALWQKQFEIEFNELTGKEVSPEDYDELMLRQIDVWYAERKVKDYS